MSMNTSIQTGAEASLSPCGGDAVRARRDEIVRLLCAYTGESLRGTEQWAAAHRISGTDVRAMGLLGEANRAGVLMTAGQLGHALGLSSPATSALIARLERGGHVTRSRDPEDRRRVLLSASPSAQRGSVEYFKPMGDAVSAALAGCDETEAAAIAAFLGRLVRNTHAASLR